LKHGKWFRIEPRPEAATAAGAALKTLAGVVVGGLLYAWGATHLAALIWVVSAVIGLVSVSSLKARTGIMRLFSMLGNWLGWLLGTILLTPVFLLGFTLARIVSRMAGRDPLRLRDNDAQTYWLPADQDKRTVRHIRSLYATEVPVAGGRTGVLAAASLLGMLVAAELVARFFGFGNPILYVNDAQAGYYPAPNQARVRYGGLVKTNSFGMRAPEFEAKKPAGKLRILMLGDSTLFGGSYVDQPNIFARRLDDLLDSNAQANDVEILNMAVNGWGPFEEFGYVEKFGTFDSDIAIVCLPIIDIYRQKSYLANWPYFSVDAPPRFGIQEILGHLAWRSRAMMVGPPRPGDKEKQGQIGIEKYVELAKKLQELGCEVLFEVLPSRTAGTSKHVPAEEGQAVEALKAALKPLNVAVNYPVALFEGKGPPADFYTDELHLYDPGHRAYSEYLQERLAEASAKLRAHRKSGVAVNGAEVTPQ